jgi:hypothetical protein
MSATLSRRSFLGTTAATALVGLGEFGFLDRLPDLTAADASATVELSPDLEPLVRVLEDTPREKIIETVAAKVRAGTSYGDLLAAILLAGVRGIKPRPVGFQFHAVLVVNSAHLASLAATNQDSWLPLFWAADNFKNSQAVNQRQNAGWKMPPVDEDKLPAPTTARKAFIEAMDNWDEPAADRAVAALYRTASVTEILELFWRYGCRDFRDIGHKAIYVANASRTLNTIGWRHAEPVLRSLTSALLEHEGDNPAKRDADPDRPFRENLPRLAAIPEGWQTGKRSPEATTDLLATLRKASPADASAEVVALLKKGVHPQTIWDGLFLTAAELLYRQPGIVGLHCVTSVNALHHAYTISGQNDTRLLTMLQGAAFLTMFREAMIRRGPKLGDAQIDKLTPDEGKGDGVTVGAIFAQVRKDGPAATSRALALLTDAPAQAGPLMAAARRLIFAKGNDSHDYKFSSAILEDYMHVSPTWRPRFLAAGIVQLRGSGDADNKLIEATRAALAKS